MEAYLAALNTLTADPSPEVRKRVRELRLRTGQEADSPALAQVCQSLVLLLDVQLERLQPHLPHIVQYMLQVLTHYEAPSWGRTRDWD